MAAEWAACEPRHPHSHGGTEQNSQRPTPQLPTWELASWELAFWELGVDPDIPRVLYRTGWQRNGRRANHVTRTATEARNKTPNAQLRSSQLGSWRLGNWRFGSWELILISQGFCTGRDGSGMGGVRTTSPAQPRRHGTKLPTPNSAAPNLGVGVLGIGVLGVGS